MYALRSIPLGRRGRSSRLTYRKYFPSRAYPGIPLVNGLRVPPIRTTPVPASFILSSHKMLRGMLDAGIVEVLVGGRPVSLEKFDSIIQELLARGAVSSPMVAGKPAETHPEEPPLDDPAETQDSPGGVPVPEVSTEPEISADTPETPLGVEVLPDPSKEKKPEEEKKVPTESKADLRSMKKDDLILFLVEYTGGTFEELSEQTRKELLQKALDLLEGTSSN